MRPAGPQLLAVDHPPVAVLTRSRPHRTQITAGIGLGEPLAPELLASQQPRKDAFDEVGSAELGHRRPEDFVHRPRRGVHQCAAGELLAEDRAQDRRTPEAADPRWPSPAHPTGFEQRPLHATLVVQLCVDALVLDREAPVTLRPGRSRPLLRREIRALPRRILRSQDSMNPDATYAWWIGGFKSSGKAVCGGRAGWSPMGSPSNEAPNLNPAPQCVNVPGRAGWD